MPRAPHTGTTDHTWSMCPWVSRTATGRQAVLADDLLDAVGGVLARVDDDALLAGGRWRRPSSSCPTARRGSRRRARAYASWRVVSGPHGRTPATGRAYPSPRWRSPRYSSLHFASGSGLPPPRRRETQGVSSSNKRERELARKKYERQQERRAARAVERKRRNRIAAVVAGLAVVAVAVVAIVLSSRSDTSTHGLATPASPSASASSSASCLGQGVREGAHARRRRPRPGRRPAAPRCRRPRRRS